MEEKGKQKEMEFTYTYPVKEMGIEIASHTIHLFESFIREKLSGGRLDAEPVFQEERITKVGCPFCQKGFLKISKVTPQYSGGPSPVPMTMHHVGNRYEYICSNPECDAKFMGTYTWMYID